jgi:hypothetical protein
MISSGPLHLQPELDQAANRLQPFLNRYGARLMLAATTGDISESIRARASNPSRIVGYVLNPIFLYRNE